MVCCVGDILFVVMLGWEHEGLHPWGPGVSQPLWHHSQGTEQGQEGGWGVLAPGCLCPQVTSPQLCGAGLKPGQFSTLCVLLEWVWLLSGAPDADRQWFHKKEAESFLSSYWREPGGCLRQRRQHWWWARVEWGWGFTFTITMEGAAGDHLASPYQYFL